MRFLRRVARNGMLRQTNRPRTRSNIEARCFWKQMRNVFAAQPAKATSILPIEGVPNPIPLHDNFWTATQSLELSDTSRGTIPGRSPIERALAAKEWYR